MDVDPQRLAHDFRRIVACGPRGADSPGAARAMDLITGLFRETGFEVIRQEFTVSTWPITMAGKIIPLAAAAALILAGGLYPNSPWVSSVILAALLVMVLMTGRWIRVGKRLFDLGQQIPGANIIARFGPSDPRRLTLMFLAHHDSKSHSLPILFRLTILVLAVLICLVLLVLAVVSALGGAGAYPIAFWILVWAADFCLMVQVVNSSGNLSPGAMDNASGVAVVTALARRLKNELGEKANLVFVASGAEELGLGGTLRFLQRYGHEFDPARTLCINFDTLGCGKKVYLAGSQGTPFASLPEILSRQLNARGFAVARLPVLIGVGMDHQQLNAVGFWAISLTQGPCRAGRRIHSINDRAKHVDVALLANIADAAARVVIDHVGARTDRNSTEKE
jgi:hypothetical protein